MEELNISKEIKIHNKDMIVSSTDKQGNIIYVNDIFCEVAGYKREELIGQPHNIVRHCDMPKVIFYFLWQSILKGEIVYAFVKNRAKNGDFYWVKAYVKPIVKNGEIVQFTSYRKPVNNFAKKYIDDLYKVLVDYEKTHSVEDTFKFLVKYIEDRGLNYQQFIDRLSLGKSVDLSNIIDTVKYKNAHIIYKYHIIDAVKNGNTQVKVTTCKECEFGKMCEELEGEPFTLMPQWKSMLKHHEHVHASLGEYVSLAHNKADSMLLQDKLDIVLSDTEMIFDNLIEVIDSYKG